MNLWYAHNLESIMENEKNKILWDCEIRTDHLISAKKPRPSYSKKKREPAE